MWNPNSTIDNKHAHVAGGAPWLFAPKLPVLSQIISGGIGKCGYLASCGRYIGDLALGRQRETVILPASGLALKFTDGVSRPHHVSPSHDFL